MYLEKYWREISRDREKALKAVKENGLDLDHVGKKFQNDKEIVLEAVKQNGDALSYASEEKRNDKEIVLEAIKQGGNGFKYLSEELRSDKEIIIEAIKQDGFAILYINEERRKELIYERDILLNILKKRTIANEDIEDILDGIDYEKFKNDKEIMLEAIKQGGNGLEYASEEIKNDKEVVLEAVKQNGVTLRYASEEIKNDKELVLKAIKQNGAALKYASEELRNDKEIVLVAMEKNETALEYASDELKNNKEMMELAKEIKRNRVLNALTKRSMTTLEQAEILEREGLQNDGEIIVEANKIILEKNGNLEKDDYIERQWDEDNRYREIDRKHELTEIDRQIRSLLRERDEIIENLTIKKEYENPENDKTLSELDAELTELQNKEEQAKELLDQYEQQLPEQDKNSNRIKQALDNTKEVMMGDKNYLDRQLEQRLEGPENAGSSYGGITKEELLQKLYDAEWEQVEHEGVMAGCTAFKTNLPGLSGILDIKNLPPNTEFYAIDPKGTGNVGVGAVNVTKNPVEETYIILGDEAGKEVVFTFHPGEPISPSMVKSETLPNGTKLTREKVEQYGFRMAKFITPEMKKKFDEMNLSERSNVKEKSSAEDEARGG